MDREMTDYEPRRKDSFGHASSANSSSRRRTLGLSVFGSTQLDDDAETDSIAGAGDIGDRTVSSRRYSGSGRLRFSVDSVTDNSCVVPVQGDAQDLTGSNTILHPGDKNDETKPELPWLLEYISYLVHLAVLGILGVLTRYLLQKLFGPGDIGATSDQSFIYLDLPSNMVGSFLMGWFGIVFKDGISKVSDQLAIGLTTGYLGSLTTFSGWNQKMLDLSVEGHWVFAVLGMLIGLFLVAYSIILGIETAEGIKSMLQQYSFCSEGGTLRSKSPGRVHNFRVAIIVVLILMLGLLWGLSGSFFKREFHNGGSGAQLWLACLVSPLGVWIRWYLARLNGQGLGKKGYLKWVPIGTLIANVSAACIMAALSTLKKAEKTRRVDTIATGIQFGLMGCLSTVSTFMAEFHARRQSNEPWRAYAYAMATILISFGLGTLIYSLPVWINGYD